MDKPAKEVTNILEPEVRTSTPERKRGQKIKDFMIANQQAVLEDFNTLTLENFCDRWHISSGTVNTLQHQGVLPAHKMFKHRRESSPITNQAALVDKQSGKDLPHYTKTRNLVSGGIVTLTINADIMKLYYDERMMVINMMNSIEQVFK